MPQTSHPRKMASGRIGEIADSSYAKHSATFVNGMTATGVGTDVLMFGTLVKDDKSTSGTITAHRLTAQADVLAGILVLDDAYDIPNELGAAEDTAGSPGLKPGVPGTVLQRGRIRVALDETVAVGDAVRYYAKVVAGKRQGAFRTSDPTGTDTVLIATGAKFIEAGTVATGAVLEFDLLAMTFTADS